MYRWIFELFECLFFLQDVFQNRRSKNERVNYSCTQSNCWAAGRHSEFFQRNINKYVLRSNGFTDCRFLLLVIYMVLRKVYKSNRRKLARIIEKFPFYIWTVFFAGYISFFYDSFVVSPFITEKIETTPIEITFYFIFLNILPLYFICQQEIQAKRISQIVREIEKEKDENKKRNLMEEYSLNEHACRKEKLIRRYKWIFLKIVCLICAVAGIGVAFFEIVGGLVLRCEAYAEFGTLAVIALLAGLFLWVVSMAAMGYDEDIEEETEKEEMQKQEAAVRRMSNEENNGKRIQGISEISK